jgi:hypothetical protein
MPSSGMLRRVSSRRNIPEDGIFRSQRRENLKSYKLFDMLFVCFISNQN